MNKLTVTQTFKLFDKMRLLENFLIDFSVRDSLVSVETLDDSLRILFDADLVASSTLFETLELDFEDTVKFQKDGTIEVFVELKKDV